MTHQTRGILAALLLAALGPLGCSPKPPAETEPAIETATPAPAQEPTPPAPQAAAPHRAVPPPAPAATAGPIRIVAWNIEWFPGHKPNATPEASAEHMQAAKVAIAELKPDILLLEEIRDWESAAELCTAVPGLTVHVTSAFQPRPQNQVVASRFTADSTWSQSWQTDGITPPRGYSFAAIELPGRRFLLTYALHLKSNLGTFADNVAMRQASAKQLLKHSSEMLALYSQRGPCAVIIGGDLNTSLDDPKFKDDQTLPSLIKAGFHWTHEGVPVGNRPTIPAKNGFPDGCFDHIFTAGLGKPTAAVKLYDTVSDHNPVVLDVDLAQADFRPRLDSAAGIALLDRAAAAKAAAPRMPAVTLDAADTPGLVAAVGQPAVVTGRVKSVGNTKTNSIHFINFEGVPRGGFSGIVRKDHYEAIAIGLGGELPAALQGKTIELTGTIAIYKDAPQIIVTAPAQIRVVK